MKKNWLALLGSLLLSVPLAAKADVWETLHWDDILFGWVSQYGPMYYNVDDINFIHILHCVATSGGWTIPASIDEHPVVYIDDSAFSITPGLTGIAIPTTVSYIGANAFFDCSGLQNLTIPLSINQGGTKIGDLAFAGCTSLDGVGLYARVSYTGANMFLGCSNLRYVLTSPGSLTNISFGMFTSCSSLTDMMIPDSVVSIDDYAFQFCSSLRSIAIPSGVTRIGEFSFNLSGLTSITVPGNVNSIGHCAFSACFSLTNATICDGVKSIEDGAFSPTDLRNITIPGSVDSIGDRSFEENTHLTNAVIGNGVNRIGWGAFRYSDLRSITIPDSVVSIGSNAFAYCVEMTDVTLGNSVTSIGEGAFSALSPTLTTVTIPASVTSIGAGAFGDCLGLTSAYFMGNPPSHGPGVFTVMIPIPPPPEDPMFYFPLDQATVFYWSGASGWGPTYSGCPTIPFSILSINDGTGHGFYTNGEQVAIAADVPPCGWVFDHWTGATQYVARVTSPFTTVTMPDHDITLTPVTRTDRWTDNVSLSTAVPIGVAPGIHLQGLVAPCVGTEKYFRFTVIRPDSVVVNVTGKSLLGLTVYDGAQAVLGGTSNAPTGGTASVPLVGLAPGVYTVRVISLAEAGYDGAYALDIEPHAPSATRVLYVNPPTVTDPMLDSFYALAPGDDLNDGLTPYTPKATLASLLADQALGTNDHVAIDSGTYPASWTVTAADAGAAYAGAPGRTLLGGVGVCAFFDASDGQYLYDLGFAGGTAVDLANANHNIFDALRCATSGDHLYLHDKAGNPSASNLVMHCTFTGAGTAIHILNSSANTVVSNAIASAGSYGVQLDSDSQNAVLDNTFRNASEAIYLNAADRDRVAGNTISGAGSYGIHAQGGEQFEVTGNLIQNRTCGISLNAADRDRVAGNTISGAASFGVYVQGGAQLEVTGNIIQDSTYGIYAGYAALEARFADNDISRGNSGVYLSNPNAGHLELDGNTISLFTLYGIYAPGYAEIHGNDVAACTIGVYYDGAAEGVYGNSLHANATGLQGRGMLGATRWAPGLANSIFSNSVGVISESGAPVAFNRIWDNDLGVQASDSASIHHNVLFGNVQQTILVNGRHDVSIYNNTLYAPQGDGVRVQGAYNVSLRNNIIWTQTGYGLSVATDSQRGFASDYNNLFTTGAGKLVWWQKAFTDLFEWQTEANYDNHSIGYTAPDPAVDDPHFVDLSHGDFHLAPGSTSIDAGDLASAFDLEPQPNGGRINLGAYGQTAAAELSPAAFITLRYPDYYTDWAVNEGRAIMWSAYNVTGDVALALYREGAGKVADIAVLSVTNLDFAWSPQDNGIAGNTTNRYRIRIAAVTNAALADVSREAFSIPIAGSDYYVNDASTVNDEYTTAAGNSRNTGKTPGDPKAVLQALLRSYALAPGDTVHVDNGDYLHVRNVVISATPGVGDDQGFTVTGPTQAGRTARFDRGNTYPEAVSVEVSGANFVTLTRLTVANGNRGVWVHNGSGNFVGSLLELAGNTLDGIRIESGAAASRLWDVQASANGESGIWVGTPIAALTNCVAHGNGQNGIYLTSSGNTVVQQCRAYGNDYGIRVEYSGGGVTTVGSTNLAAGLGNWVYDNRTVGIYGYNGVLVAGNTVHGQAKTGIWADRAVRNVVYGNSAGIYSQGSQVEENRVYGNASWGINSVYSPSIRRNVVYSNGGGINNDGAANALIENNLVYANGGGPGVRVSQGGASSRIVNNTIYQPTGDAVWIGNNSAGGDVRNNILWTAAGHDLSISANSHASFSSDYNLLYTTNSGQVGSWQGADIPTLQAWRNATFRDANSAAHDPQFVSVAANDFHEQSPQGSFHGASFAPVLDAGSGLPVFLPPPAPVNDAAASPAIDRGDASFSLANEPAPNGSFINVGAYGNTEQASLSPNAYLLLLVPDGGEVWPAGQTFNIRWRSHDTNDTVTLDLLQDGAFAQQIADHVSNSGTYGWQVPGVTPGSNYSVRVTRNGAPTYSDTSEADFTITPPIRNYYVNDTNVNATGDWTTAPGNDGNDGLTPATPKASVRAVLTAYTLGTGDVIRVDDGTYALTENLLITDADSGVRIEGYHDAGYPDRKAVLDRGNPTLDGAAPVVVSGADDVVLSHLWLTGGYCGLNVANDADRLRVEDCVIYGNYLFGIFLSAGCDFAVVTGCDVYGVPGGAYVDDQYYGIGLFGDSEQVTGCTVHNHAVSGIRASGNRETRVEGNEVYGNASQGIILDLVGGQTNTSWVVGNQVHGNGSQGIDARGVQVRVEGNRVWSESTGIQVDYGAQARNNVLYGNVNGISVTGGGLAEGNRVYQNSSSGIWGTGGYGEFTVRGNQVYANGWGIYGGGNGRVENNLVYANANGGIRVGGAYSVFTLQNNTVYQPVGNAVQVEASSQNVVVKNNVLWVDAGYDLSVAADSQTGFQCDYNLLHTTGTGRMGSWQGASFANLADWYYELGFDAHSQWADPQFVNPAGADNVLGYDGVNGVDCGQDDDFHLQAGSCGIDGGDPQSYYLAEPWPNGERINLGAYGNTAEAELSPAQLVQVLYPNGREKFQLTDAVTVQWRSSGLTTNRVVARINAGGGAVGSWLGDAYQTLPTYSYSFTNAVDVSAVNDPAPQGVYQSYATYSDRLTWSLPVPDGSYTVRLHFAEPSIYGGVGSRVFDIRLQGSLVEDNFDILAAAGAAFKAVAKTYTVTASAGAGLTLELVQAGSPWYPMLSGMEVTAVNPGGAATPTVNVAYSADNGGAYTPVTNGVALDAEGKGSATWAAGPTTTGNSGFIRVTAQQGSQPQDVSDAGFSVANAGRDYYINDTNTANDVFTTAAGNNANSGKSPDAPMASLPALLAAYALGTDAVVHVDTGEYHLLKNAVLSASGVRVEGPATQAAVLDRGNPTLGDAAPVVVSGADDVVLSHLWLTGGYCGLNVANDADRLRVEDCVIYGNYLFGIFLSAGCDFAVVTGCDVYGVPGGAYVDDQYYGIGLFGDSEQVTGCTVHNHAVSGIRASGNRETRVEGNEVYGNASQGIILDLVGGQTNTSWVVGNQVHGNGSQGIDARGVQVRVEGNRVWSESTGIQVDYGAQARNNVLYGNVNGISVTGGGLAEGNRVYQNSYGIQLSNSGAARGNQVYANGWGIYGGGGTSGSAENNLVYANANGGIRLGGFYNGFTLQNNTVYQPVGNAVQVEASSQNVVLKNNVLWVDAGYDLYVAADSQTGFQSDYNLFNLGTDPNGRVGCWNGANCNTFAAWQAASGQDGHGLFADPLFVDPSGPDNVLGYTTAGGSAYDGGEDDNFQLQAGSPAIDRGASWGVPPTDFHGFARWDDSGTPNAGPADYQFNYLGSSLFATQGVARNWRSSGGGTWTYNLPFAFPFYDGVYSAVTVSSAGLLQFAGPGWAPDPNNSTANLLGSARVAPLWDNLRTDIGADDIYIDESVTNQVTIRWAATATDTGANVNMAVTLCSDGRIRFDYGPGNTNLTPTVGIARGDGAAHLLAPYDGQANLANAISVEYALTANGTVDIGAFEFQGSGSGTNTDTTSPVVTGTEPPAIHTGGTYLPTLGDVTLNVSEPVDPLQAANPLAYELRCDSDSNGLFNANDVLVPVTPSYAPLATNIVLTAIGGDLPAGRYRLTVFGNQLHDLSGNALAGATNGVTGGDYVRVFRRGVFGPPITATAGTHGAISPNGTVQVPQGDDQSFVITSDGDYHVADVTVDGVSVGAVSSYTFTNVLAEHSIVVAFEYDLLTIHQQPQSQTNMLGTTATLTVTATSLRPIAYQWRKDGAVLTNMIAPTLTITNVQVSDAGSYDVVLSDTKDTVNSAVAVLTVSLPLQIVSTGLPPAVVGMPYNCQLAATGGVPPYAWSSPGGNLSEQFEAGSFSSNPAVALGLHADDGFLPVDLPFAFPFFGGSYTQCFADSNGRIRFDYGETDYTPSLSDLQSGVMIAGLWGDLSTYAPDDVYVSTNDSSATIRWDAHYLSGSKVDFAITLQADGRVRLSYGPANISGGFIGISGGDGSNYLVSALSEAGSMSNAQDIVFRPNSALPAGLTLDPSGAITGTPTVVYSNSAQFYVTDQVGSTTNRLLLLTVVSAVADTDHDGLPDWEEYIAGTDPTNPASFFPPVALSNAPVAGTMNIVIDPTSSGRVYGVYWETNLLLPTIPWPLYGGEQTGTGARLTFTVTNDVLRRFYRTGVRLP